MVATLTALTLIALAQKKHIDVDTPAVKALYPKINRACESKDMRAIGKMVSPKFVEESPLHKKLNKAQFMKKIGDQFGPVSKLKMDLVPLDVQIVGNKATVEVRYTMTGKMADKKGQHFVKADGSETHVWHKGGRMWMLDSIKEHEWTFSMDGRIVQREP